MKISKKVLAVLLSLLMIISVMMVGVTSAYAAGTSITYSFTQSKAGFAQGTITVSSTDDTSATYYLYWADDTKALENSQEIGIVKTSAGQGSLTMPKYTAIPADATKVIAIKSTTEPAEANRTVQKATAVYDIPADRQLPFSSSDALYTFGAISDPQLANDSYGGNSYPNDETHLKAAFETLNDRDVDFSVVSGDVVNDQDGNRTFAAEYKRYQKILADSSYSKPIYESNGNHDVGTVWNENGNYYNDNTPFIKATGLDSTEETIKAGKPYFEVTEPTTGDHFIFMALEGGFYTNKGTQFSEAQLDWLEGLLKKYSTDGKNIFIIEHANVAGWGSGDKTTAPYYYNLGLVKSNPDVQRFIKLMETYKECVIITGHTHLELSAQYNYSDNSGTSAVMMHNSAIGGVRRLINGSVNRDDVLGLSEGYIVEVYEDCILFNGTNMYYNETMPQCSYIIPFDTEATDKPVDDTKPSAPATKPADTTEVTTPATSTDAPEVTTTVPEEDPTETTAVTPAQEITITLKSSGSDTDWVLNSTDRVVTLVDNATGKEYTATLTSAGWELKVPADVTDVTFHRVKNGTVSHTWIAGNRGSDVNYFITGDSRGHWENEDIPEYADVYLPGAFNNWDQKDAFTKTADANIVTRTLELAAGTYKFKVMEGSTWLGNGGTIQNTTTTSSSGGWEMTSGAGDCTLVATGGVYTFNFNTSTNKLIVLFSEKTKAIASVGATLRIIGDADLDTDVNIKDATLIQKYCASLVSPEDIALKEADVNADNSVNIKDATDIQKYVAGLIDGFEAENTVIPTETTEATTVPVTTTVIATTTEEPTEITSVPDVTVPEYDEENIENLLAANYIYSSYDQYQALKYNLKVTKDSAVTDNLIAELEAIIKAAGGSLADSDIPVSDEITVYFTNNYNWGTVKAYVWGSAGAKATWPGENMTYVKTNSQSQKIYSITFSYEDYQNIIFTDGSKQTVDITLTGKDGIGYYIDGESSGKYTCSTYTFA